MEAFTPEVVNSLQDTVTPTIENEKLYCLRKIMLYSMQEAKQMLSGIKFVDEDVEDSVVDSAESESLHKLNEPILPVVSDRMSCSVCGITFENRNDQVDHFQSDWHRFNIRQKLSGLTAASEQEFERMTGDISSISGSEMEQSETSDSEVEVSSNSEMPVLTPWDTRRNVYNMLDRRRQKLFFRNSAGELIAVHRCTVYGKLNKPNSTSDLLRTVEELPSNMKWAVVMSAGGHFAGAIFNGEAVIQHKTFHRYIVRAKRGTAQSLRDSKGNAPKSAGATLRRYNEAALTQEVQDLITSWVDDLKGCSRIFLRAPSFNRAIFFGGKSPVLDKTDKRIRLISIETRRPTFRELERVHRLLATIECFGADVGMSDHIRSSPRTAPISDHIRTSPRTEPRSDHIRTSPRTEPMSDHIRTSPRTELTSDHIRAAPRKVPVDRPAGSSSNGSRQQVQQNIVEASAMGDAKEESSSENDSETDLVWHLEETSLETGSLQPYQCTRRPRRKKKNATKQPVEIRSGSDKEMSEDLKAAYDRLFTACKTGDATGLMNVLDELKVKANWGGLEEQAEPPKMDVAELEVRDTAVSSECTEGETKEQAFDIAFVLNRRLGPRSASLLHVAARAGHKTVIRILLEHGADPTVKDDAKQLAYVAASNKEVKSEFRRFMAQYPDKYDYAKAQVPSPLSEEMENERKAKAAEKKKQQKKVKKDKVKELKREEEIKNEEGLQKQKFLALSDREKRAYAAEQRFKIQQKSSPSASRCWQCGVDMTGKVPFEYYDFKFCTPSCLKEHKLTNSTKT